jgi:hypothetical protein
MSRPPSASFAGVPRAVSQLASICTRLRSPCLNAVCPSYSVDLSYLRMPEISCLPRVRVRKPSTGTFDYSIPYLAYMQTMQQAMPQHKGAASRFRHNLDRLYTAFPISACHSLSQGFVPHRWVALQIVSGIERPSMADVHSANCSEKIMAVGL